MEESRELLELVGSLVPDENDSCWKKDCGESNEEVPDVVVDSGCCCCCCMCPAS